MSEELRERQLGSQPQGEPCWQPQPQVGSAMAAVWQPQSHPAPTQELQVQIFASVFMGMLPKSSQAGIGLPDKFPYSPAAGLEFLG